jgi:hypothetical protein
MLGAGNYLFLHTSLLLLLKIFWKLWTISKWNNIMFTLSFYLPTVMHSTVFLHSHIRSCSYVFRCSHHLQRVSNHLKFLHNTLDFYAHIIQKLLKTKASMWFNNVKTSNKCVWIFDVPWRNLAEDRVNKHQKA